MTKQFILATIFSLLAMLNTNAEETMVFKSVSNGGNCYQCGWLMAQGKITESTPRDFTEYLDSLGYKIAYIKIHSEGGSLSAALELGRMFRDRNAEIEIGKTVPQEEGENNLWYSSTSGKCLSACAYAFLGAYSRNVSEDSELGFHQFFDNDILDNISERAFTGAERLQDQYVVGVLINYLIEMGISTELYPLIASTPPGNMMLIETSEAIQLKIHNIEDPVNPWTFVPFGKGLVAETSNDLSGRRVRLYCSRNKKFHVAYFFQNEATNPSEESDWGVDQLFTKTYQNLVVRVGEQQWPANFNLFTYTKDKTEMIFVFDIPKKAAVSAAEQAEFSITTLQSIPRVHQEFFGDFAVLNVGGDKRVPQIALRNCI